MQKTKFDLLFEEIMNNFSDKEIFGTDVHNSILKVYKWKNNDFSDVILEISNFKFLEPSAERLEIIDDLKIEEISNIDEEDAICKIIVFDKETNKILFDVITYEGNAANEIIDTISYV